MTARLLILAAICLLAAPVSAGTGDCLKDGGASTGHTWGSCGAAGSGPTFARVATLDYTNATTTPSDITGLSFAVEAASVYSFGCSLLSSAAATTTGIRPGFTFPLSTHFRATCRIPSSTTALTHFNVTSSGASCDATASQGTGVAIIDVAGTIETTSAGTLQIQGESEISTSLITVYRGSHCWINKH